MTHVDAFTNLPGYWAGEHHSRVVHKTHSSKIGNPEVIEYIGVTGNSAYSESYKSALVSGITSGRWRKPTAYSRCVSRCESLSAWKAVREDHIAREEIFADSAFAWHGIQWIGNPFFSTGGSISISSDIVSRAETEAMSKVTDRKVNLGVALGESVKTVDWLATKATQLYKAYRHLRKGQFRDLYNLLVGIRKAKSRKRRKLPLKARSFAGTPASWWLQYWYAFVPLVHDVYGVAAQVEKGLRKDDLLFSVTRTITQPKTPPWQPLSTSHMANYLATWESSHATESCRVKLWGRVDVATLASLSQLGLLNPALIAWELVPFSFVVDWVIPIGNYLESLTATSGVSFHDGFRTTVLKGKSDAYVGAPIPGTGLDGWTFVSPARGSWKFYAMSRQPYYDWPAVSFYSRSPWSTQHVITAIALILNKR